MTKTTAPATESHTIDCGIDNTYAECRVSFTAPYYIEADLGQRLIWIDPDCATNTYSITETTYLGTEITYTVTYEVTEWDEDDEGMEYPSAAEATITHD